jgi:N-acetylglutamate synthase-like GNAT family acetyltransferase
LISGRVSPSPDRQNATTSYRSLIEEKAKMLGINKLCLWTEHQREFYQKRDYRFETSARLGALSIQLLSKELD